MHDAVIHINTSNSASGWSEWPWKPDGSNWWDTPPIKGFEW